MYLTSVYRFFNTMNVDIFCQPIDQEYQIKHFDDRDRDEINFSDLANAILLVAIFILQLLILVEFTENNMRKKDRTINRQTFIFKILFFIYFLL